jgi:hypothetical protein
MTSPPSSTGSPSAERQPGLAVTVGLYALARLGLVAVVAALLLLAGVPMVLALLVALIVALPLSMVLFRRMRSRLDAAFAQATARRAAEKAVLRARLRGDAAVPEDSPRADDPATGAGPSDEAAERETDPRQD